MGKNHSVKRTYHVKLVEERITQQKDVGKALELIYVPKGLDQMIKPRVMKPRVINASSDERTFKMADNIKTSTSDQSTSKKPDSKD